MRLLKDEEEKNFFLENAAEDFITQQEKEECWKECYIKELAVQPVDNVPILLNEISKKIGFSSDISEESITETMEGTKMALSLPIISREVYPIGPSAIGSLVERAGYKTSPVLLVAKNKPGQKEMSPTDKSSVLNNGLSCFEGKTLVLIRDEKIRAVLSSGDLSGYVRLPIKALLNTLKESLNIDFPGNVVFSDSTISHEFVTFSYIIEDKTIYDNIVNSFKKVGIKDDMSTYKIIVKMTTSDVGLSGANLYPVFANKYGREISLGESIKLTHKDNHSMNDFKKNVSSIVASFKDITKKIEEMYQIKIKNPAGCIKSISKKTGLPKKIAFEKAEKFEAEYGLNATGADVFWCLFDILDEYIRNYPDISSYRKITLNENISRIVFWNIKDYDFPFDWE